MTQPDNLSFIKAHVKQNAYISTGSFHSIYIPIRQGKLYGTRVTVMRDTGCNTVVIRSKCGFQESTLKL